MTTVLVTGASSGLGKHTAAAFAALGCSVYGTSREAQPDQAGVKMLELDVRDGAACRAVIAQVVGEAGGIDVLVNNAGFGIAGPLELTSDEDVHAQLETNLFGAIRMTQAVLPLMRVAGAGRIVNVGSVAATMPIPYQAMYAASKAALEVFSQAVGMEVAPFGIKCCCIEFGDMKTGFTARRQKVAHGGAYEVRYAKSVARMEHDEQSAAEPVGAARLVTKLAMAKNPKPMVVCGPDYKALVALRRVLPLRASNAILAKLYG